MQREEVGNILKITPQINEGASVLLKISQEASSIAASSQQVSSTDLITNKRTITTNVMVEDGGIIVLGGLIEDQVRESKSQVPFLGSIPILGELFKTRSIDKVKSNLMVFIRPRILRDGVDAAIESNAKYNYMRDAATRHQQGQGAADADRAAADAARARAAGAARTAEPGPAGRRRPATRRPSACESTAPNAPTAEPGRAGAAGRRAADDAVRRGHRRQRRADDRRLRPRPSPRRRRRPERTP